MEHLPYRNGKDEPLVHPPSQRYSMCPAAARAISDSFRLCTSLEPSKATSENEILSPELRYAILEQITGGGLIVAMVGEIRAHHHGQLARMEDLAAVHYSFGRMQPSLDASLLVSEPPFEMILARLFRFGQEVANGTAVCPQYYFRNPHSPLERFLRGVGVNTHRDHFEQRLQKARRESLKISYGVLGVFHGLGHNGQ
jgi:hypothetical protein